MKKKDLVKETVEALKRDNIKKQFGAQKTVLHIMDDDGNRSNFTVKKKSTAINFNATDVAEIIDAAIGVALEAVKSGDDVMLSGLGTLGVKYREKTRAIHPGTKQEVIIEGHYVPKFSPGGDLKIAAKLYNMSVKEREEKAMMDAEIDDEAKQDNCDNVPEEGREDI